MIEMLIVLSILSAFSFSGIIVYRNYIVEMTQTQLVHDQQLALSLRKHQDVDLEPTIERFSEVWFNAKGNVNTAQTLRFGATSKLIIQLGPGRMHE